MKKHRMHKTPAAQEQSTSSTGTPARERRFLGYRNFSLICIWPAEGDFATRADADLFTAKADRRA